MTVCAPVLFLVFNRPEQTRRVFGAIRAARPNRLYVAADGPRSDRFGERERCEEARTIATAVDWPCELQTLFRANNLGCREAVASSVSWFFNAETQGIILEDDCLPTSEFFVYATELLDYYADDTRVMKINGFNPFGSSMSGCSYFYSHFGFAWGWASWRRVWHYYNADISPLSDQLNAKEHLPYPFYKGRLDEIKAIDAGLDTWDYQLEIAISSQHGLQIVPASSLVINIGFGLDATHTKKPPKGVYNSSADGGIIPIVHPSLMLPEPIYERRLLSINKVSIWTLFKLALRRLLKFPSHSK
jgi:hypothetical protein